MFALDPRLERDTLAICDLDLCQVRLLNDRRFPWVILVPRIEGASELHDLSDKDYKAVMQEVRIVTKALLSVVTCDKINIAALGNKVRQLHIHIIARNETDVAWPGAVWDKGAAVPYEDGASSQLKERLQSTLLRGSIDHS